MTGIQLRALRIIGKGKQAAEVLFLPGTNVISGASNTGKSYIFNCIDFICGAGNAPKSISQSIGYETVEMEFTDNSGELRKFERSLQGGSVRQSVKKENEWLLDEIGTLAASHTAKHKRTISGRLLEFSGLWDKRVRKDA